MSHRFGRASYALMHDFWLADRSVGQFFSSSERDALPAAESAAMLALLFDRLHDARRAVECHPPWVMTPDRVIDGVACRTGAALERALAEMLDEPIPAGAFERVRSRLTDFVGAELRRVEFDTRIAQKCPPTRADQEKSQGDQPSHRDQAVDQVVQRAVRDHLGRFGYTSESPTYAERRERLADFAFEVIARHERSKRERGWFGWFFRRRNRG